MQQRLVIQQKLTALVNRYRVLTPVEDTGELRLIGLAQQKRIALKEKILFYTDETRQKVAFTLRAEKVMDVHGRYFVEDQAGKLLGMFKKEFGASLVNSTWKILDAAGNEQYVIRERSQTLAILRRFLDLVPIVGDIAIFILPFFRYHFVFIDAATGHIAGNYAKTTLFRDRYSLETDDELWNAVDWRVLASVSIALDALQSR